MIFSQWTSVLKQAMSQLDQEQIGYLYLDGSMNMKERMKLIEQFQNQESKEMVFMISLMAGNAGITLTEAQHVFILEPWWNTAIENQAIDRTHRIGQTKNVFAYKMICKDTIEERILEIQMNKKVIGEDIIQAEESFTKSMTIEDIEYLFS